MSNELPESGPEYHLEAPNDAQNGCSVRHGTCHPTIALRLADVSVYGLVATKGLRSNFTLYGSTKAVRVSRRRSQCVPCQRLFTDRRSGHLIPRHHRCRLL